MCGIWRSPTDPEEELEPRYLERLPSGLGHLNLTGGEPMLREDIVDVVDVLVQKARLVEVSTNGYFTDRIVELAYRYPQLMFRISVEGLPTLNDRLRGIQHGFDHALRTMLELLESPARNIGFSIVICDRNASDLLSLYRLCCALDVELGNSVMHNSWYFHKMDNVVRNLDCAVAAEREFIEALLRSKRRSVRKRLKDYLRAYFNVSILNHLQGKASTVETCCAGRDLFFVDPWGNVLPCNGSPEPWVMGNLKNQTFESIWNSDQANRARRMVDECKLSCAFIGTARSDMRHNPLRPVAWIAKNKWRLARGGKADVDV